MTSNLGSHLWHDAEAKSPAKMEFIEKEIITALKKTLKTRIYQSN